MIPNNVITEPATRPMTKKYNKMTVGRAVQPPSYNDKSVPVVYCKPIVDGSATPDPQYTNGAVPLFEVYGG